MLEERSRRIHGSPHEEIHEMTKNGHRWAAAAIAGVVSAAGGCASELPISEVPGAPSVDPAGVPAARAAEPASNGDTKMACGGAMGCGGMKPPTTGAPKEPSPES